MSTPHPAKSCSFYAKNGTCRFGDQCKFQHGGMASEASQNNNDDSKQNSTKICAYYAGHGTCRFGDKCRFKHGESVAEKLQVNVEEQANYSGVMCSRLTRYGICRFGDKCRFRHSVANKPQPNNAEGAERNGIVCPRLERFGICRFGDKCRFKHGEALLKGTNPESKISGILCKSYVRNGNCLFGDKCRFKHEGTVHASAKVCPNFAANGICRFGDQCKFQHSGVIPSQPRHICRHFQNGNCQLGSNCKFLHNDSQEKVAKSPQKPKAIKFNEEDADRCPQLYCIVNERGEPKGRCHLNKCYGRHFSFDWEEEEDAAIGWTMVHEAVFHSDFMALTKLLEDCEDYEALLAQKTRQPHTIEWSEPDFLDNSCDKYKLTVPAGSTPMDVAMTSIGDLDKDSPSSCAVVQSLLGSVDGDRQRKICFLMLRHPEKAQELLEEVLESGELMFCYQHPELDDF
jgi:hypothetical protein